LDLGSPKYWYFGSQECEGGCDFEVTSHKILTSSEPSIGRDVWREISILLTRRREKSMGGILRTHKDKFHNFIMVVRSRGGI
jgi:hypothetical protein